MGRPDSAFLRKRIHSRSCRLRPAGRSDEQCPSIGTPNSYADNFASSSPQFRANTNYPQALANHLHGSDSLPNVPDINITFNANVGVAGVMASNSFYLGTDGAVGMNQVDFVTTALHEIGHGLGFSSSFRQDGSYGYASDLTVLPGVEKSGSLTAYDSFITVGTRTPMVSLNQSQRAAAVIGDNLFWNGANGVAGNGGSQPKLYAPSPFYGRPSHLDATVHSAELMNPFNNGPDHVPSAIERRTCCATWVGQSRSWPAM